MQEFAYEIIRHVSLTIGLIGMTIILIGSLRALGEYIRQCADKQHHDIRTTLGSHLVLGLDFLVGKDIIDTLLLLETNGVFWKSLAGLVTVVAVRIVLTHFLIRELNAFEIEPDN